MKMKRNLLKTMLCTLALLPVGAWGQTPTSWDFTSWSEATITNLEAVATTTTPSQGNTDYRDAAVWNKIEGSGSNATSYYYDYYEIYQSGGSGQSAQTLKAGSNIISETDGLTFVIPNNVKSRLRIDNRTESKALYLSSTAEKINIPGLVYGKKVTITCKGNKKDTDTKMVSENINAIAYKQAAASTANRTDVFVMNCKLTSATTIAFKISAGSMNIYTISIEDATEDEKNYANAKSLFDNDDVITATSLWSFDQYNENTNIDGTGSGSNYAGLYIKGHTTSGNNVSKLTSLASAINTYGTLNTPNTSLCHWFAGGRQLAYGEAKNRKASSYLVDNIALNIGVPGTLFVTASSSASSATNYKITITRGNSDDTQSMSKVEDITSLGLVLLSGDITAKNNPSVYSAHVPKTSTCWISATGAYNIHTICFVPDANKEVAMTKTVTLTSAGGGYATFSAAQNYVVPEGVTAYYVSNVDGTENKATMTPINAGGIIPACTGVVLYKSGVTTDTDITLTSSETYSSVTNSMMPNLADYALPANAGTYYNYTLAIGPTFKHSSGAGTLAAGKAFLRTTVNATSPTAPVLNIAFGGSATGIEKVAVEQQANGVYYNLAGQRVAQPTKGLYIVNGKKVVIK